MTFWTDRRRLLKRGLTLGAAGGLAGGVSACANGPIIGFDKAKKSLDIANNGEPLSLDPHKASGTWENNIIGNMFLGLTTEGPDAEPVPGMAERWETSADGKTWTFYLREAYWSDGEACDAHDFVFALRRILNPENLAEYAQILYPIENAQRVNKGELAPNAVGVTALGDRVLQIRLEHPAPYLPLLLRHYTSFPVPKHVVEQHGDAWIQPENVVVNGPYTLTRWWSNYIVHLAKNDAFYDAENVELQDLYFYPITDVNASARKVLSGEAGWSTRFPANQYEALKRDLPGYPRVAPYLTTNYLSFNMTKPPFDDKRVRVALTMAVDREFIANNIYKTGETPAYAFVPLGITNYPRTARYPWADTPLEERRAEARRLLEEAGYGPDNPLQVALSHRNTSDNPRVAVVIQADWRAIAPWVVADLRGTETQVHYANLRAKNFEVGDGGWIADYNDPSSHLALLETRTAAQNYPGYSNPEYDRLMEEANNEVDAVRRMELMAEAEQVMLADAPVCTTVFMNSTNLVHPDLGGYVDNGEDIHRARWFTIKS